MNSYTTGCDAYDILDCFGITHFAFSCNKQYIFILCYSVLLVCDIRNDDSLINFHDIKIKNSDFYEIDVDIDKHLSKIMLCDDNIVLCYFYYKIIYIYNTTSNNFVKYFRINTALSINDCILCGKYFYFVCYDYDVRIFNIYDLEGKFIHEITSLQSTNRIFYCYFINIYDNKLFLHEGNNIYTVS